MSFRFINSKTFSKFLTEEGKKSEMSNQWQYSSNHLDYFDRIDDTWY